MSDLIVSHGTRVAPEELWAAVAAFDRSEDELLRARCSAQLGLEANWALRITGAIRDCIRLRDELNQAITAYTEAERVAAERLRSVSSTSAWLGGFAARLGFPQLGLMAAAVLIAAYGAGAREWAVQMLRQGIEASDDAGNGALAMPMFRQQQDAPSQIVAVLLGVLGLGAADTALRVSRTGSGSATAPMSVADLAARVPTGTAQIRIERYGTAESPRWIAYVAGTATGALRSTEPFDMRSNLDAVAKRTAASQLAVETALQQAGVKSGDPVMLVGHSQGGIIAAGVAESGRFNVQECVTLGAPLGTIDSSVPTLAIEHRQDPIPALAGVSETSSARTVVVTDAPDANNSAVFAAHRLSEYQQTAQAIDQSADPELQATVQRIHSFASGSGLLSAWRAQRTG